MLKFLRFLPVVFYLLIVSESCKHEPVEPVFTDTTDTTTNPPSDPVWTQPPSNNCDPNTIYFANYIQKLVVTKCATLGYSESCHDQARSTNKGLKLLTYGDIIKALNDDDDPLESDFWEKIEDDEMPRIGGPLTPDEKANIRQWIQADMPNNSCNDCSDYSTFSESIAPLLYLNCSGCHNTTSKSGNIVMFNTSPYSPDDVIYDNVKSLVESGVLTSAISRNTNPMPKFAEKLYECEFNAILAWKDAGFPND